MIVSRSSFYEKEYEEVSKALERVGVGGGQPPSTNKDSSDLNDNEATVIATTPKNENHQEKHKTAVKELEDKVRWLESQVAGLEASNGQKQAMISELKAQWSGALTNWTKNQQELVDQVQQARRQVDILQLENASAKEVTSLLS